MSYEYLIRSQIAKRNLTVAERIRLAEKSRPAIEKAARERQRLAAGGDRRSEEFKGKNQLPLKSGELEKSEDRRKNETDVKLAKIAGVGADTYRKGKRVLDSGNQEVIDRMAKGELSVNAAYKAIVEGEQAEYHGNRYEKSGLVPTLAQVQNSALVKIKFPQNFGETSSIPHVHSKYPVPTMKNHKSNKSKNKFRVSQ